MNIDEEILETIRTRLPEIQCKAITDALTRKEQLEKENEELKTEIDGLHELNAELSKAKDALYERSLEFSNREQSLINRERKVKGDEIDQLTDRIEAKYAREQALFAKDVALGLVRNIEYRKEVFRPVALGHDQHMSGEHGTDTEEAV